MAVRWFGTAALAGMLTAASGLALAQTPVAPPAPATPPAATPPARAEAPVAKDETLVYIFSGSLTGGGETYSGTLVAAPDGPQFEMKLGKGATCDGNKLEPDKGLLRMPETPCSDGRAMKALFVYQAGGFLRVYGTVGGEKFATQAHALPSEAEPEAAPKPASPPADLMERK